MFNIKDAVQGAKLGLNHTWCHQSSLKTYKSIIASIVPFSLAADIRSMTAAYLMRRNPTVHLHIFSGLHQEMPHAPYSIGWGRMKYYPTSQLRRHVAERCSKHSKRVWKGSMVTAWNGLKKNLPTLQTGCTCLLQGKDFSSRFKLVLDKFLTLMCNSQLRSSHCWGRNMHKLVLTTLCMAFTYRTTA